MIRTVVAGGAVVLALGLGVVGPGVAGLGVTRPGVTGAGVTGAGVTGAGVTGAGVTGAGVTAPAGGTAAGGRTFTPPLDAPLVVARPFDRPAARWAAGHRGVDLAAHPGQAVHAPESGVVTFAGTVVDRGVVTVAHPDGLRSTLEPVRWSVRPGQRVVRRQAVGDVDAVPGHCAPATCLHWGLRRGDTYLDPMRWVLGRAPVVLLPTG